MPHAPNLAHSARVYVCGTELDTRSILETLARLPVGQWRYKVEPSTPTE
jgi:hypothetical protein